MTDIVDRLRTWCHRPDHLAIKDLLNAAADEIQKLRAVQAATDNPAAWLVSRDGDPCYVSLKLVDANMERNRLELVSVGTPAIDLIPLYRLPTITDAEREAINVARIELNTLHCFEEHHSHTLLKLLERTQ